MEMISRTEAIKAGLKRFYTGVECIHGHLSERMVSTGACVECQKIGKKKFRDSKKGKKANLDYQRKYSKLNRPKMNTWAATRRSAKVSSTMTWGQEGIEVVYAFAKMMERTFGEPFDVDHSVPLMNDKVCGLHVEDNLRVMTAHDNRSKGNKWCP